MSSFYRIFVYGTLKRGEPNHSLIKNQENGYAKFLGAAKTVTQYPLVIATMYNIPFLLKVPNMGHNVCGEVYEVDDKMLLKLDELEDHPSFYQRTEDDVQMENSNQELEVTKAWIYFLPKFRPSLLEKSMLNSYSNAGSHGLQYVCRYSRDPSYNYKLEIIP